MNKWYLSFVQFNLELVKACLGKNATLAIRLPLRRVTSKATMKGMVRRNYISNSKLKYPGLGIVEILALLIQSISPDRSDLVRCCPAPHDSILSTHQAHPQYRSPNL